MVFKNALIFLKFLIRDIGYFSKYLMGYGIPGPSFPGTNE